MAYILYKTDFQHSFASRDLQGVFTNKAKLDKTVRDLIKEGLTDYEQDNKTRYKEQLYNVDNIQQTQGLDEYELVIEEITLNTTL